MPPLCSACSTIFFEYFEAYTDTEEKFCAIAGDVGALLTADIARISGLVAVEQHPAPSEHCDRVDHYSPDTPQSASGNVTSSTPKLE